MALKSLTFDITSNKTAGDSITITTNFGSETFDFVNVTTGAKFVEVGDTTAETRSNLAKAVIKELSIDFSFKLRETFIQNDNGITIYCLDETVTSLDVTGDYDTKTQGEFNAGLQLDTPLFARTPKFVIVGDESSTLGSITGATALVYIYKGEQIADRPSEPTYSFNSISNISGESLSYNVAEIAKDYLEYSISSDGSTDEDVPYYVDVFPVVYYDGVEHYENPHYFRAFLGYSYFEDGSDRDFDEAGLLSTNNLIINKGAGLEMPVDGSSTSKVKMYYDNEVVLEEDYTYSGLSSEQIRYSKAYSFEERVDLDSGTFESGDCVESKIINEATPSINRIDVFAPNSDGVNVLSSRINVISQCESKYEPIRLTFVNKNGAYERMWFFKRSSKSTNVDKEEYKANLWDKGAFDNTKHQNRVLTKNSVESLSINSGFYPESVNETINQLLLSEQVWAEYEGRVIPVNISDSSMEFKTSINDKLINYKIKLNFAFNHINNIS